MPGREVLMSPSVAVDRAASQPSIASLSRWGEQRTLFVHAEHRRAPISGAFQRHDEQKAHLYSSSLSS